MGEWGWVGLLVRVVGLTENKANSAPIELEFGLRLSLAIYGKQGKKKTRPLSDAKAATMYKLKGQSPNMATMEKNVTRSLLVLSNEV